MNLEQLSNMQPVYDELKLINKKAVIDYAQIEILGFKLANKELNLYGLEYGEETDKTMPFHTIRAIEIDGVRLEVSGSQSGRLEPYDTGSLLLVNEFVRLGFSPSKVIATVGFPRITLTQLRIMGEFDAIPVTSNPKTMKLTQSDGYKDYPVNQKLSLEVGKNYPQPFKCGEGEERVEFYINKVYLMDFKAETQKAFENPELISKMTSEELEIAKLKMDENLELLYPGGMLLPVIEYETEEISLHIKSKRHVDTLRPSEAVAMGVIMRPATKIGSHGLPLRAITLEAVSEDITTIEVELVHYSVPVVGKIIEI